jgi:hypothetical protein
MVKDFALLSISAIPRDTQGRPPSAVMNNTASQKLVERSEAGVDFC